MQKLGSVHLDRAAGVLLGQACGDALGVPYEFPPPMPADVRAALQQLRAADPACWRAEVVPGRTANDPALHHYRGLSLFSSMSDRAMTKLAAALHWQNCSICRYFWSSTHVA